MSNIYVKIRRALLCLSPYFIRKRWSIVLTIASVATIYCISVQGRSAAPPLVGFSVATDCKIAPKIALLLSPAADAHDVELRVVFENLKEIASGCTKGRINFTGAIRKVKLWQLDGPGGLSDINWPFGSPSRIQISIGPDRISRNANLRVASESLAGDSLEWGFGSKTPFAGEVDATLIGEQQEVSFDKRQVLFNFFRYNDGGSPQSDVTDYDVFLGLKPGQTLTDKTPEFQMLRTLGSERWYSTPHKVQEGDLGFEIDYRKLATLKDVILLIVGAILGVSLPMLFTIDAPERRSSQSLDA